MPDPFMMLPLALLDGLLNTAVVIVGIGFLIFVHELGHFLVAKWNKVRVEAFSLGFGPVLWGFKRGDTHYRLSAIPLGGYVKMAGEIPTEEHTNDPAEFQNKSVLARAAILIAGVVMNGFFAVVLFVVALNIGVPLVSPEIGRVVPGSAAWAAGLQAGDRIIRVNETRVMDFDDVGEEIAFSSDAVEMLVKRDGEEILFTGLMPKQDPVRGIRTIGIEATYDIMVAEDSAVFDAGVGVEDEIVSICGVDAHDRSGLERVIANPPETVSFLVRTGEETRTVELTPKKELHPSDSPLVGITPLASRIDQVLDGGPAAQAGFLVGDELSTVDGVVVANLARAEELALAATGPVVFEVIRDGERKALDPVSTITTPMGWGILFESFAAGPWDMKDARVALLPDSLFRDGNPARAAGLVDGARILTVGGVKVTDFETITKEINETAENSPVRLTFSVRGEEQPEIEVQRRQRVYWPSGLILAPVTEKVRIPGVFDATKAGIRRSLLKARRILQIIPAMFTGKVSAKNLGGPIAIFSMASTAANKDFVHFLYFLGILSINLAILNILPIPILDGGHLAFLAVEAIRGKPLSERTLAAFQWLGLLVIVLLMVFVMANDVIRQWG